MAIDSWSALFVLGLIDLCAARQPLGGNATVRSSLTKRRLSSGVDLTSSEGFTASTSNFAYSTGNACGCALSDDDMNTLAGLGYYGVATPAWLGSPYPSKYAKSTPGCGKCGDDTCFSGISEWDASYRTCPSGFGGCTALNSQCWQVTVTDDDNIYGAHSVDTGTVVNVFVVDNCEMENSFGNNQQWCVPFTGVPDGGCQCNSGCASTACMYTGDTLTQVAGSWEDDGTDASWTFGDCGSADDFQCTNAAGYPAHFDFAINSVDSDLLPWDLGASPIVTAKPITCSDDVTSMITDLCSGHLYNWCSDGTDSATASADKADSDSSKGKKNGKHGRAERKRGGKSTKPADESASSGSADPLDFLSKKGNATCKQVDLPDFDMTNLTAAEMNATCGPPFEEARGAAWECIKSARMAVNNCSVEPADYYLNICSCRDVFNKGMSNCNVSSDLIEARVKTAEISFDAFCTVGNAASWFAKHIAIILGFAVFGCVFCCLCITVAICCFCFKRK